MTTLKAEPFFLCRFGRGRLQIEIIERCRVFFEFSFNLFGVQSSASVEKIPFEMGVLLRYLAFKQLLCSYVLEMMIYMVAREFARKYVNICMNIMQFVHHLHLPNYCSGLHLSLDIRLKRPSCSTSRFSV